jgi:hypothetical protein
MGYTICITNFMILLMILGYLISNGRQTYPGPKPDGYFLHSHSIFNSAPEFCFTFHFQIYFLIVLQYLGHRKKVQSSYKVGVITNVYVLIFCIAYCVLCLNTNIVFKDFREAIINQFSITGDKIIVNVMILWLTCLQVPFKFFLEKEFLFILYDELRNRSISSKVEEINNVTSKAFS